MANCCVQNRNSLHVHVNPQNTIRQVVERETIKSDKSNERETVNQLASGRIDQIADL